MNCGVKSGLEDATMCMGELYHLGYIRNTYTSLYSFIKYSSISYYVVDTMLVSGDKKMEKSCSLP